MIRKLLTASLAVPALVVALATTAGAHVGIDPEEATAGAVTTVTLSFHHGKDGTATTGLSVQLPEGASVVAIPAKDGWTAQQTVEGGRTVVTWSGGSVPDGQEGEFPVEVRLPATPGVALFPTVQVTEAGELAWIEEGEGEGEDASPAPRLTLVADPAATTTTAAPTTTTTAAPTTTTAAPTTTVSLPGTVNQAESRDDGDQSPAPWLIGSGVAAAVAIGVGGWVLKRRS
ncbi:MAG: DUF1775 domain-containing protein [Acidimicrobiia bacterium]